MADPTKTDLVKLMEGAGELGDNPASLLAPELVLELTYSARPKEGSLEPRKLTGRFVFRRPTVSDQADLAVAIARLTRGLAWTSFPFDSQNFFVAVATCNMFLKEKPKWFSLGGDKDSPVDSDILIDLASRFQEWNRRTFRLLAGAGPDAPEKSTVEIREVVLSGLPNPGGEG